MAVLLAIGVAGGFRPVESAAAVPLVVLGLGVMVWFLLFLLFLLRVREEPTLRTGSTPWAERATVRAGPPVRERSSYQLG